MGHTTTAGLAAHIAALLRDQNYILATLERYDELLDSHSGAVVRHRAERLNGTGIFCWDESLLHGIEILDPLPDSDYEVMPMHCRIVASADRRPTVDFTGMPVDLDGLRRELLEPLISDGDAARRYLQCHGLLREQIQDSPRMIQCLIQTGSVI